MTLINGGSLLTKMWKSNFFNSSKFLGEKERERERQHQLAFEATTQSSEVNTQPSEVKTQPSEVNNQPFATITQPKQSHINHLK